MQGARLRQVPQMTGKVHVNEAVFPQHDVGQSVRADVIRVQAGGHPVSFAQHSIHVARNNNQCVWSQIIQEGAHCRCKVEGQRPFGRSDSTRYAVEENQSSQCTVPMTRCRSLPEHNEVACDKEACSAGERRTRSPPKT